MTFTGRTGIAERTYDQTIIVRPAVGATLPVAGAIMGGATVGAAVFVLQKLLPSSPGMSEVGEIRYRVTGGWDEPVVEKIAEPEPEEQEPYNPWQQ